MAETPLRWARIDEDLMTAAREAAAGVAPPGSKPPDDSTVIRAGLYLVLQADAAQLAEVVEQGRKVAGWPKRAAS